MLNTILLSAAALIGGPSVTWEAPILYSEGAPFPVSIELSVDEKGSSVDSWLWNSGGFTINGKPLSKRGKDMVKLPAGSKASIEFDLAPAIQASKGYNGKPFKLAFDSKYSKADAIQVKVATAAPKGLDFMEMPLEDLSKYQVIMNTNRGILWMEFWPEAAPNHVRNFMDLCYTGFYDNVIFHRVMPGFMIQGGDQSGTGTGQGKRMLDAEFSTDAKYSHKIGVLSMARGSQDINSASSQFFVMHGANTSLDGQYSAFGRLMGGQEVVNLIANTPAHSVRRGQPATTPMAKQVILSTQVILAMK